ncbi:MAG: BamA/TamA family outer membrane protein [Candidatus Poribacteria bacterium]|nr:BamA/TamA family outer membrane protein [Candidatus Poribacteria bacterium]
MKTAIKNLLKNVVVVMCFLLLCGTADAQKGRGKVSFNWPNAPSAQFKFDLDRRIITQIMENPNAEIASLYKTVDNLYLRNYHRKGLNYQQMLQYYMERLTARGWSAYQKSEKFLLYTIRHEEFVVGIFVIVHSGESVYLINITGEIPPQRVGDMLRHLNQLGIDIPELKKLGRLPDSIVAPLKSSETAVPVPNPSTTETKTLQRPVQEKKSLNILDVDSQTPLVPSSWKFEGIQIHDFIIQNTKNTERTNIYKFLESGSGDLENVLPMIIKSLGNRRKISVRITEEKGKSVAILTVENRQRSKSLSILKSLTITESGANRNIKKTISRLETDELFTHAATRFRAGDAPIHEIRIQGNQQISEERIHQTLNNGSENIEQALKTLFKVMPYFKKINLKVTEENFTRVATITVDEKRLSSNAYLGLRPPLFLGFNRVTNWEIGTGFQMGKPIDVGPLWMWNVQDTLNTQTYNLFGKISYTFGNPHFHYRFGTRANWGKPYIWDLGLTAQLHRQTSAMAPELFPNYNHGLSVFQRILGYPDLQNYYLRQGGEVALRWSPAMPIHSFKLGMLVESHTSLDKSTDWNTLKWLVEELEARENPSIDTGQMRSLTFRYDFDTRVDFLGWHNTLLVEHSNSVAGSDFDFTRVQLHFRYAFPLDDNRIRTRLFFGFADTSLPIQRKFVISGLGGLRGYPLYVPTNNSEKRASKQSWYGYSQYAFMGDRGFLLNVEYHYRLANLSKWRILKNAFLIFFLDEGQVWNISDAKFTFNPKADVGIGLQFQEAGSFRINIAKTLDSWEDFQTSFAWYHGF